ncbi:unnamed protein product [marine sediment metagenome]|uniref:HTH luxR-type domain-containing protein n=1 Tax=marine sediment metagenome TaxID=412755 RepID=X1VX16_9ZZZZ
MSDKLTPLEIEFCTLIENGLISKEIAMLTNIICKTVGDHQKNIRKKLAITNKDINLASFLQHLES